MATLKEIEKLERSAEKKQAEARELAKKARLARARLPRPGVTHGGAREGSGAKEKGEGEKRVQESFNLLPSTLEAIDAWAAEASATRGKKVSPRVLVEAATRAILGLPLDADGEWALGKGTAPEETAQPTA